MTEITTNSTEKSDLASQKAEKLRSGHGKSCHFTISQQEALRRATLLKHRKVSTQLKLDMVQRQLSELRNSSSSDRQFYRSQLSELSNELEDLGNSLEKVERSAFYARRRMLRCTGVHGILQLSASHPAIYSSSETLDQSSKNGLKNRMHNLMPSPTIRFRKKHLLGELRSSASLSSLHVKSTSHSSCDDIAVKDSKVWKAPFRFLGHIVDNRICRKIWGSAKRTKSEDNVSEEPKSRKSVRNSDDHHVSVNGLGKADDFSSSSSSSEADSSDESDDDNKEWETRKAIKKHIWKGPVERKVSSQKQQIDPAILAEIDDFEKMAAQYIKLHT